ncbi:LysE family translocator [Kytococcus sedentarius]|uniref:LysE family translocator n=1 Tax=Kytococcus sedentarius TaxID=1276 RepID=UPI0035BC7677
MHGIELAPLLAASLVLAAAPGPDTLLTLRTSAHGLRQGLRYAAGAAGGIVVWALASLVVLQAVVQSAPEVLRVVGIAGGMFLLWMGYRLVRSGRAAHRDAVPVEIPRRPGLTGLVSSLTNPKTGVIFLAVFPQALPDAPGPAVLVLVPALVAAIVGGWLAALGWGVHVVGARAQRVMTGPAFEVGAGLVMATMGVVVLLDAGAH